MGHAFGDGEEGNEFCYARTWQDFIGRAFHLIQQTVGLLKLNEQKIGALTFESNDGKTLPILQLLNWLWIAQLIEDKFYR